MKNASAALTFGSAPRPTDEQIIIVDTAKTGVDFKIMAYAGAGKTSTLRQIADALPSKKGQYIAFNKEIVTEAKGKFPNTVVCSTAHGLAYGAVGRLYAPRLNNSVRRSANELASEFAVEGIEYKLDKQLHMLDHESVVRAASNTLQNFVKSADPEPTEKHVNIGFIPAFRAHSVDLDRPTYKHRLTTIATKMWADLQAQEGICRFTHDHYLKIWQLTDPVINKDFILFDEAQDADPVMLDIVNKQQCQRIICGDSYQAIYEWRGAVDALSRALKHKPQLYLTQSFRFGNSIANAADEILMLLGATKSITGFGDDSRLKPLPNPQTVLCRTNGGVIGTLLNALMKEKRVHVAGGVEVLIAIIKGCQMLQDAGYSHHPELAGFFSWQELIACIEANEEDLGSLKVVANLVEKYGCYRLLNALQQTFPENRADLIVSTAHRAKGREWDSVRIAGDFQMLEAMQEIINHEGKVIKEQQTAELRLAYVAVTRAKKELDIGALCFGVDDE